MHASTRNLVTCSAPKCGQPATVVVARCAPPEAIKLAVDGSTYYVEHDPVDIDYCAAHAPDTSRCPACNKPLSEHYSGDLDDHFAQVEQAWKEKER